MATPTDLGLAEFVSALVSETMDAVGASLVEQEERRAEVLAAVKLDAASFAQEFVLDEELMPLEQALIGGQTPGSGLEAGQRVPAKARLLAFGIHLGPGDVRDGKLTTQGVATIRTVLRLSIGERRQAAWRELDAQGLPRVVVDQGRILAKVNIEILDEDEGSDGSGGRRSGGRRASGGKVPGRKQALGAGVTHGRRGVKMKVRPAPRGEEGEGARADLYGEVEVQFRTVF